MRTSSVEVGFQDPPGVAGAGLPSGGQNPANGVVLYQPNPSEATAYLATCTLPAGAAGPLHGGAEPFRVDVRLSRATRWGAGAGGHHSGEWQTASTLLPSGSRTKAP